MFHHCLYEGETEEHKSDYDTITTICIAFYGFNGNKND